MQYLSGLCGMPGWEHHNVRFRIFSPVTRPLKQSNNCAPQVAIMDRGMSNRCWRVRISPVVSRGVFVPFVGSPLGTRLPFFVPRGTAVPRWAFMGNVRSNLR